MSYVCKPFTYEYSAIILTGSTYKDHTKRLYCHNMILYCKRYAVCISLHYHEQMAQRGIEPLTLDSSGPRSTPELPSLTWVLSLLVSSNIPDTLDIHLHRNTILHHSQGICYLAAMPLLYLSSALHTDKSIIFFIPSSKTSITPFAVTMLTIFCAILSIKALSTANRTGNGYFFRLTHCYISSKSAMQSTQ